MSEHPEGQYLTDAVSWRNWPPMQPHRPHWLQPNPDLAVSEWGPLERFLAERLVSAGVDLVMGTDSLGVPMVFPGSSAWHELHLLSEAGLTPYQALQTATVHPAEFLGKSGEFGVVAEGARADLLLLTANPLERIEALSSLDGIVVRGRLFTLDELRSDRESHVPSN